MPCLLGLGVTSPGWGPRARLAWEGLRGTGLLGLKLPARLFGEARPRLVVWRMCPRSGAGRDAQTTPAEPGLRRRLDLRREALLGLWAVKEPEDGLAQARGDLTEPGCQL